MFTNLRDKAAIALAGAMVLVTLGASGAQWGGHGGGSHSVRGFRGEGGDGGGQGIRAPAPSEQHASLPSSFFPHIFSTQSSLADPADAGFIVHLPDPNAEVWFQDYKTQQRGTLRYYESGRLDPKLSYTFQVRARWLENGQQMDETRQVQARAGQTVTVGFAAALR
jgi:uncharacterized protein (TIGR03000 family)